jgi:hypothetical protein
MGAGKVLNICMHRIINYKRHQSKMSSSENIACKGTLQQVFIRVYRLEIQSIMLALSIQLCKLLPF